MSRAGTRKLAGLVASGACILLGTVTSRAEIDVRTLVRGAPPSSTGTALQGGPLRRKELSSIIELPNGEDPTAFGLPRIGSRWSVVRAPLPELDALTRAHPAWQMSWSAPLQPLLDRAAIWTGATKFRSETLQTGKGVVVGIVDTGVDVTLADFRNPDGTTRVAYLIDYATPPVQSQTGAPTIASMAEARCTSNLPCSVRSKDDIDKLLAADNGAELPTDSVGHGTHVASLAAGNGGAEKKYVGIAPEASIIVASVVDASGNIDDATILSATDLVFWLAEQEGAKAGVARLPAVVNLSLGSDFGPHDGTSSLEESLASYVGPDEPGRSIVVAAGNSAGLYDAATSFPKPLGVHTDVDVPDLAPVLVPLVSEPASDASTINATIFVWISFRPEDDVRVGVDRKSGPWVTPQGPGVAATFGDPTTVTASIFNGQLSALKEGFTNANAAAVVIDGTWSKDETFAIRLEGKGTANLWVQSEGDLGPETGALGAVFPAATKESTVTMPAASAGLIAVGATLNRTSWTDRLGDLQTIDQFGSLTDPPLDSIAFFSSAGPTMDMRMKPDLVAPGAFVVGAMSSAADPKNNPNSIFAEDGFCSPASDCAVVDATHAVTLGTSMSSPIVAGAVALLFQGEPTLTQDKILTLLQAGARHPAGAVPLDAQVGAGALYLPGSLDVEKLLDAPVNREPSAKTSWLTLGQGYAHPDPTWTVPAVLQLRDANARAADGFDATNLTVDVTNGELASGLEQAAPGFVTFAVAARSGTGGDRLDVEVRYKGELLAAESVPIAVDVNVVSEGFAARGGCAIGSPSRSDRGAFVSTLSLALMVWRGRRRNRGARTARSPDRTDS